MKYTVRKIARALKKAAALVIYVLFSVITFLAEVTGIIYKMISLPLVAMILLVAGVTIFSSGFQEDLIPWIAGSFIAILIRLLLPAFSLLLHKIKDAAKESYHSTVICVKSPVRFTL